MKKIIAGLGGLAALLALSPAQAQGTIKIGLVMSYTGQFADLGTMMDTAVRLYVKKYGDTVAGLHQVEEAGRRIDDDRARRFGSTEVYHLPLELSGEVFLFGARHVTGLVLNIHLARLSVSGCRDRNK